MEENNIIEVADTAALAETESLSEQLPLSTEEALEDEELSKNPPDTEKSTETETAPKSRYEELIALGLTEAEATLAATASLKGADNRAHLYASVPRGVHTPGGAMSPLELREAREIFGGISDEEIKKLYTRVTKQN